MLQTIQRTKTYPSFWNFFEPYSVSNNHGGVECIWEQCNLAVFDLLIGTWDNLA